MAARRRKPKAGNLTVFLNLYHHADDSGPDYRGFLTVDGVGEYEVALWTNKEVGGAPVHLSGQVTTKGEEP